jgi:hypothetical protein
MKKGLIAATLLLTSEIVFAQTSGVDTNNLRHTVTDTGIGLGTAIAVVASWSRNKSILWAILHGILSWIYVIYYAITRD